MPLSMFILPSATTYCHTADRRYVFKPFGDKKAFTQLSMMLLAQYRVLVLLLQSEFACHIHNEFACRNFNKDAGVLSLV